MPPTTHAAAYKLRTKISQRKLRLRSIVRKLYGIHSSEVPAPRQNPRPAPHLTHPKTATASLHSAADTPHTSHTPDIDSEPTLRRPNPESLAAQPAVDQPQISRSRPTPAPQPARHPTQPTRSPLSHQADPDRIPAQHKPH